MDVAPILVVEDEPDDVRFVRRALRRAGLSNPVLTATTVDEAREACVTGRPPVLVVLDVYLSGRSGLDFLAWLRERPKPLADTPVVVFTASTDRAHEVRAGALSTALFLGKPATPEVLVDAIEAMGLVQMSGGRGKQRKKWLAGHAGTRGSEEAK